VIAEQLYQKNIYFSEGELTRRRALGVNNNLLADVAIRLDIGPFLLLGKGEVKQEGSKNRTNLANALEAVIGAVYLDSDMETVRGFIFNKIYPKEYQF
jgi:ribonuclease-3